MYLDKITDLSSEVTEVKQIVNEKFDKLIDFVYSLPADPELFRNFRIRISIEYFCFQQQFFFRTQKPQF